MSSTRLPVFGMVARVALWGGFFWGAGWSVFGRRRTWNIIFQEEVKAIRYAVCIAVDRCLSKARLVRGSRKSDGTRLWKLRG